MTSDSTAPVFPCPFCRSGRVSEIGGVRLFVFYRCEACQEVWTGLTRRSDTVHPAARGKRSSVTKRDKNDGVVH